MYVSVDKDRHHNERHKHPMEVLDQDQNSL